MMRLARVVLTVVIASAGWIEASAQSVDRRDVGRLGQPRRAEVRGEWETISPGELLCVDERLRRARRSVNTLIDRGIGPGDNRVAGIVSDCRAGRDPDSSNLTATPSFNCRAARQADEMAICATPELARLDRAVVQGYERMVGTDGSTAAQSVAGPLLSRRHACGPDIDCIKRVQLTAIAAFQARGAPVQAAPAQATARDKQAFSVAGMQLGNNVAVGSPEYRDYTCAPTQQYAGFTGCQRQTAERSRRRRVLESVSFLHAADGSAVYINQQLDPVAMDENDAGDEINRLSETLGKATLLPTQSGRGVPSGLIASWGAVSLQPLEAARTAELAAGTDDKPGILVDAIGSPQRSAQLGLPIYRLGGGAGYVWSASWNDRGRGTLRMLAVDASRLPDAPAAAKPPADAAAISPPTAPAAVAAAPTSPPPEAPKPAVAAQRVPVASPEAATAPPAPSPPADVRVVGPPIALQPAAPAPAPPPTKQAGSAGGNSLNIFLIALIVLLIGAVGYLLRKSRGARRPAVNSAAPADVIVKPAPATPPEVSPAPKPEKMDLAALIPAESPASIAVPPASSRSG